MYRKEVEAHTAGLAADADCSQLSDDEAPPQVFEVVMREETPENCCYPTRSRWINTDNDDTWMCAGRVRSYIGEVAGEGDEHAAGSPRGLEDLGVSRTGQPLARHSIDIVAVAGQSDGKCLGEVLVELELHSEACTGTISSPARSAP